MRLRSLAPALALLICACPGREPPANPTSDPRPPSTVAEPASQTQPVSEIDGPEYFFAVVSQAGVEHCPNGEGPQWLAVSPTLGWIDASGPEGDEAALEALLDLPVLARGSAGPASKPLPLGVTPELCPPMQMRSDWQNTPRGIRVQRTDPPAIEHFYLSSVRRLDELRIEPSGDELLASFQNPLPFALTGVRLRMHYEGCYGKPGSTAHESEALPLAPGETLSHRFPSFDNLTRGDDRLQRDRSRHVATALVLEIAGSDAPDGATVHADLDVSLTKLGLDLSCESP